MATLYDSLESDIEEEEERILSEQHGEAAEDVSDRKRKDAPDMDYSGDVQLKKRMPRPKVTAEKLTGMNGLIRIPDDFKSSLRTIPRDCKSAAKYTSTLMKLYSSFCFDLLPSHATADVLLQIENLGSKKEVKAYLQNMRDAARSRHVEHLLGREKAEKLLNELELGLRQQEDYTPEDSLMYSDEREARSSLEAELENQPPSQFVEPTSRPVTRTPNESRIPKNAITRRFGRKSIHDDSSDEEQEAVFDEPTLVSPIEKEKRTLPDQNDDDDDASMSSKHALDKSADSPENKQQDREDTESIQTDSDEAPGKQHDFDESNKTSDEPLQTNSTRENSPALAVESGNINLGESYQKQNEAASTMVPHEHAETEEQLPTQANDHENDTIPFAQATQDIQDSQPSENSTKVNNQEQQTQMSEAPTIVADTQSMEFETQMSQVNDGY